MERAERAGINPKTIKYLKRDLRYLEEQADARLRELASGPAKPRRERRIPPAAKIIETWSRSAAKRLAPTVQQALKNPKHWRHRDYSDRLTKIVSGNKAVPQSYKERLSNDIAEVLSVTPDALGLVKEATLRGPKKSLGIAREAWVWYRFSL